MTPILMVQKCWCFIMPFQKEDETCLEGSDVSWNKTLHRKPELILKLPFFKRNTENMNNS